MHASCDTSHFCHAADEDVSPSLIGNGCVIRSEDLHVQNSNRYKCTLKKCQK